MWERALFKVWLSIGKEGFQGFGVRDIFKLSYGHKVGHYYISLINIDYEKRVIKSGTMGFFSSI